MAGSVPGEAKTVTMEYKLYAFQEHAQRTSITDHRSRDFKLQASSFKKNKGCFER